MIQGGTAGTYKTAGVPNLTGNITGYTLGSVKNGITTSGVFIKSAGGSATSAGSGAHKAVDIIFDASDSNSIYGNSNTVQPPALCVNVCIKY